MKKDALYRAKAQDTIHCPQCGHPMPRYFRWTKLLQCNACNSSIFLADDGAASIGQSANLSPEPSLCTLHVPLTIHSKSYTPIGKIRYSYGRGFWEEWCLLNAENRIYWLSIDEGDFVLESKAKLSLDLPPLNQIKVGTQYGKYTATEKGYGECVGFAGELPEAITLGERHFYVHFSQAYGSLLTVEGTADHYQAYTGYWIDPIHIKKHH